MPNKPDVLCAGGCGRLRWRSKSAVPATCDECRARGRGPRGPLRLCEMDDCDRKHYALGLCRNHYKSRAERKRYRARLQRPPRVKSMIGAIDGGRGTALVSERLAPGRVMVWCVCGNAAGVVDPERRWVRECAECGALYRLNEAELSWFEVGLEVA